jgi:hypothetical protein
MLLELIRRMRKRGQSTTTRRIFSQFYTVAQANSKSDPTGEIAAKTNAIHMREFKKGLEFLARLKLIRRPLDEWFLMQKASDLLKQVFVTSSYDGYVFE